VLREDAAAETGARLEHDDATALPPKRGGGGEPRRAGADYSDVKVHESRGRARESDIERRYPGSKSRTTSKAFATGTARELKKRRSSCGGREGES